MENSICSSDEERKQKKPKTKTMTLIDFDKQILKAISEQSIASLNQSGDIQMFFTSTPNNSNNTQKRNSLIIKSTPNIPLLEDKSQETPIKPRRYMKRHRHSTNYDSTVISTPNLSSCYYTKDDSLPDNTGDSSDDKNVKLNYSKSFNESYNKSNMNKSKELNETRSISGSISSKGVHFCPIVAEVNWKDEHASTEHETSSNTTEQSPDRDSTSTTSTLPVKEKPLYKQQQHHQIASSSSEREINDDDLPFFLKRNDNKELIRPEPRKPSNRISTSQPDLAYEKKLLKQQRQQQEADGDVSDDGKSEEELNFVQLRRKSSSQNQLNSSLKRRGSQIVKR